MRIPGALLTPAAVVISALFPFSVHAQQSAADCAQIENNQARLECFDRFYAGAEDRDARASERASSRVGSAETDTERARREADQARREAAQARQEAAQARQEAERLRLELEQGQREVADLRRENDRRPEPEADPRTPEERFGMEKKVLELGGEEMSSTALGEFRFWNQGQRIELDNGQVWEIVNSTNLFHKTTNPRVTIEKGLFSSFYLHIDGVSKSLKVKRIR